MKIDSTLKSIQVTESSGQPNKRSKSKEAVNASGNDSVSLSDTSSRLNALESAVNASSDFDVSKVEEISKALAQGNYRISSDRIADGLLASSKELFSPLKA